MALLNCCWGHSP